MALTVKDQAQDNVNALREHDPAVHAHMRANISAEVQQKNDNRRRLKNVGDQSCWMYWDAVASRENSAQKKAVRGGVPVIAPKNGNFFGVITGKNVPKLAINDEIILVGAEKIDRGINISYEIDTVQNVQEVIFAQDPDIKVTRGINVVESRQTQILQSKARLVALQKIPRKINKRKYMNP